MQVLDEIRPYLVGTGGGGLTFEGKDDLIVKVGACAYTCVFAPLGEQHPSYLLPRTRALQALAGC